MPLDSFNVYHSYLKAIEPLNDAECGRLLRACLQYSMTGEAPELRGNERFIFPSWQSQIDRDREKYEARCRKNKENISVRWNTDVYGGIRTNTKRTKDKDKDKDKDKENKAPHTPRTGGGGAAFERFWAAYPKKVGKQAALKSFQRVKVPVDVLLAALDQQKRSDQWTRENGRFIPNPATWLNQGRWEDELESASEKGVSECGGGKPASDGTFRGWKARSALDGPDDAD